MPTDKDKPPNAEQSSSYWRNLVIAVVSLRSRCYGNNVRRWMKLQEIIHLSIGHSIPFRWIFHCIVAIDTEVYWHYGNNQIAAITRCGALARAHKGFLLENTSVIVTLFLLNLLLENTALSAGSTTVRASDSKGKQQILDVIQSLSK